MSLYRRRPIDSILRLGVGWVSGVVTGLPGRLILSHLLPSPAALVLDFAYRLVFLVFFLIAVRGVTKFGNCIVNLALVVPDKAEIVVRPAIALRMDDLDGASIFQNGAL